MLCANAVGQEDGGTIACKSSRTLFCVRVAVRLAAQAVAHQVMPSQDCLLYTSDAADE